MDHYLVMANLKTKLSRGWNRNKTKTKTRLATDKLKDSEAIKIYYKTTSNLLDNNTNCSNKNSKDKWEETKKYINKAAGIFEKIHKKRTRNTSI